MIFLQDPKKHKILKINNSENFRDNTVLLPNFGGQLLPLNNTYLNPYVFFELITKQLNEGTHQFRIDTIDDNDNETLGIPVNIIIPSRVLPPRFLSAEIDGTLVTIRWTHSVDGPLDRYAVFGTDNVSNPIDRVNEYEGISVDGSETSVTFNLAVPGDYRFTIDSKIGSDFSNNFITVDITSPSTAAKPPRIINQVSLTDIDIGQLEVFSENVSVGRLNVQFFWVFAAQASSFNLYHDSGTGVVDFGSPINLVRTPSFVQNLTTPQICFDNNDTEYKFVLRAVSPNGVEDNNTHEHTVILNGSTPPNAELLEGQAILC